jgi:diguanylate cyclase (GGDEF)-like protein/PAS domain S-box-containing protein
MHHFFTTLRFRLILLVFLAVLPALGVILYSGLEQRRLAADAANKDVEDLVTHASLYQERVIEGVRQMLFTLAELPAVRQQNGPVGSAIFARIVAKQKIYGNIWAVDRQGRVFATGLPQPGLAPSDVGRSHFERALKTRDFAIGEFGIGRASGKPTLFFAYPVIDNDVVQGVVSTSVILDYLNTLVARTKMPTGSMLTVIDRHGTILARHPQPEPWVGKRLPEAEIIKIVLARGEGVAEAVGIDGVPCLFAFTPLGVGSHDLWVYAGVPLKTVYGKAHRTLTRNLLALGGAGLLALIAAWMLGQVFLINRTRTLVNQAQQFAGGDLRVRSQLSYDDGEFGQLAQSFDEMAATLQQRQESLRESEEKYRTLVEQLPAIIFVMAPDEARTLLYVSPPAEDLLGVSPAEYLADPDLWKSQVHPDDRDRIMAEIEASFATLTPLVDEIRMQSRSGALLWFHTQAMPVPDPSGRILYLQGVLMDITDRKRVEEALEASEFRYRTLVENVDLGITLIGSDYKIIMTNAGMGKIFGKPPQEFVGKYCFREFEKREGICPHCPGAKAMASGQPEEVETTGVHDDGTFHYAHVRTFPTFDSLGNVTGFVEVVEDTTARRLAEAALEEERRQKEAILNNIPDIAWLKDKESQYLSVNDPFAKTCGVSPQEMVGKNDLDIWPLDLAKKYRADDQEVIRTGNRKCFEELLMDTEKGMIWIETIKTPILNDGHEVIGTTGISRDITSRKQMEEALKEANVRLQILVNEAEERNRKMALLNDMSDMLQTCQTSEEAFTTISHFVPKFFPTDAGALYLLRNSKNLLSSVTTWGPSPPIEELFPPDDCWAVRGGRVHRVDDPASALLCKHITVTNSLSTGYLCVPLVAQGVSLGILHIRFLSCATEGREAGELETKQRLAVAIAENLALALANLKLRETLQNQAIRDPLTGLYNRRYLEETMDRELHRSRRLKAPLGVVMMDLDHFKDFNDAFGHAAGDTLLSALANVLTTGIRSEDIVCRYGGEEFLLVMPGAALPATQERAENLRQAVQALQVKYQDRFLKSPTLSLGVAIFPDHGVTAEEVIAAADTALYRAKQAGRDRVEIASLNSPAAAAP